ncbi:MAG TPA: hypothetical protein ENN19_13845 [Chloroflexi bacterium]|nr:hypothetical protein [Chloroflexota bacterium]
MVENEVAGTPMGAPMGDEEITQDDKLWALLSYIFAPLVGIIVLLLEDKKDRPFIKYNAVVSIILGILVILLSGICIGLFIWIYAIYLGIKSYQGEWVEVPVISDFVRNQGWA